MTKPNDELAAAIDQVDAIAYGLASRRHTVKKKYSWKAIVGWFFYNLVLGIAYFTMPESRAMLFAAVLGASSAMLFRPLTKRWKYTMTPPEYPDEFQQEVSKFHNKRTDGQ